MHKGIGRDEEAEALREGLRTLREGLRKAG